VKYFDTAPTYTDALHLNNYFGKSNIDITPSFYGSSGEAKSLKHSYLTIYDKSDAILFDDSLADFKPMDVPPRPYRSVLTYNDYFVGGGAGMGTLECSFDLRKADANPPMITSFKLLNAAKEQVASLHKDEKGSLVFSATDILLMQYPNGAQYATYHANLVSTEIQFRVHGTEVWETLPVAVIAQDTNTFPPIGTIYSVQISPTTTIDTTAIDIRLHFVDPAGNQTDWTLEPAYAIGDYKAPVAVERSRNERDKIPQTFALHQNYPNPFNPSTSIGFDIPYRSHVSIVVYDMLGRMVKEIVNEERQAGKYLDTWDGSNNTGQTVAGGVYFCRMEAGGYVQVRKMIYLK
jgi:hypothetical protein